VISIVSFWQCSHRGESTLPAGCRRDISKKKGIARLDRFAALGGADPNQGTLVRFETHR
jgi:hypothetical protein